MLLGFLLTVDLEYHFWESVLEDRSSCRVVGFLNSDNWNVSLQSIIKDYTNSGNCDKISRPIYAKCVYEIMKLESKIQDECVYLLSGGHLTANTV